MVAVHDCELIYFLKLPPVLPGEALQQFLVYDPYAFTLRNRFR